MPHTSLLWKANIWQMTCPGFERITPQLTRYNCLHWGKQNKVWRYEGLLKTHHLLRLLWCPVEESGSMWTLLQPAGLVQSNQPFSRGPYPYQYTGTTHAPGITSTASRTQNDQVQHQEVRMTKVNQDMKPQAHNTHKHAKFTSYWKWSDAHLDFQNGSCRQKCKHQQQVVSDW